MTNASKGSLKKKLRNVDWVYRLYGDLDLFRKHGSFRPTKAKILGSSNVLFADPTEPRGRGLLRDSCAGQPEVKAMWMRILERVRPDIVLDVGVNYGEFLFMPTYAAGTRIYGVEAAPALEPFLRRSRAHHPNRDQIELVFAAAGPEHGGTLVFHVDPASSGKSSVVVESEGGSSIDVEVPCISIDGLLAPKLDARKVEAAHSATADATRPTLAFKIDVESYEEEVLSGMSETLNACDAVGLIEFDPPRLLSLDRSPDRFLGALAERFSIWAVQRGSELRRIERRSDLLDPEDVADLVLVGTPELERRVGLIS
ncbi:MAG: FkbM family methyltransferase [Candidatus Eisenbacteria bacterium]